MFVPTNYISGGIWRGLIGLLYWWRDIIRGWRDPERSGEACLVLLYWWKDIKMPVHCSYINKDIL